MRLERLVQCVDTHSCGEATRVVLGGLPAVRGSSMQEKYDYFRKGLDEYRTSLFQEPRGFENQLGAFVLDPCRPEADFGVIYASATQYFEMCGDSTFSVAKVLVETGMVAAAEPVTKIRLDTYGGIVEVRVSVQAGCVGDITYRSVPAFLLKRASIEIPELGEVSVDIAFGGLWYGFVETRDVGIEIDSRRRKELMGMGMKLLRAVNEQVEVVHPLHPGLCGVALITFYETSPVPGVAYRIANVYGEDATCRSPAGTMTSARASISHARGELESGVEMVVQNGWIGSEHKVKVVEETTVGDLAAIVPELTASAYITGMYQGVVECNDPHANGFLL